ncbi:MAG TPA: glycoside hydrolase family 38 C-terminal domain-containing protein, partial [Acidimicrobiales bacterium]|nr:glycoside hydrolase family 38 C-terminal domain-containing protein [Acidimicrobiales bacterium]
EAHEQLRRLVASGQLSVGPWYVLPDEFCVSGETLVRNLELGLERAADLGGAMEVGYLPDMFGHVAQMPQLLRLAGFENAVVWRGVPAAVDRTGFWWSAPDGSTVRAEYLPVGYGNGASVPDDAKRLLGRIRAHEVELGPLLAPGAPMLWMNGTDHQVPQPWLGRVVAEVNALQDDYRLVVTSLPEYMPSAPTDGLPSWTGELRSGARANLLMGVASNRVDVKQAAARAERALERRAEPLCALFLPPERWPVAVLRLAWREVVRNAAHDSSCACSVDEVVDAVLHRYAEARQMADGLADRALAALGASLSVEGPVAVNPTARARSGLVEVVVPGDAPPGSQVLAAHEARSWEFTVSGAEVGTSLGQLRNRALAAGADVCSVAAVEHDEGLEVVLRFGTTSPIEPTTTSNLYDLYARAGAHRDHPVWVRVEEDAFSRALVRVDDVPSFGWRAVQPGAVEPVRADGRVMENGLVSVDVDPADGTFSISDGSGQVVAGLDRLVDDGDAGDTYNWSPPAADVVVDRPDTVRVEVVEAGPLRAVLAVIRRFAWPEQVVAGARAGVRLVEAETRLELRAGERLVRVTTSLDNRCRDHRLRSWFPLPEPATSSRAECAFGIVERGLAAEGGPHEAGLPTFPSRRFVSAGGLTVVHEGLLEYEVVDEGRALALTLLRAVGLLSGTDLGTRPQPAGPPVPVEGAQMQGRRAFRYAVVLGEEDPWAAVDDAFLPLEVATGSGHGTLPPSGSALTVEGGQVSAVRRAGRQLEVRVFNPTPAEATVSLGGRSGRVVDLRGRPVGGFDRSFALRPWGIATARLD